MMDMDKLIAAVEAGHLPTFPVSFRALGDNNVFVAEEALDGSLDAAHRLHDALLPGWGYLLRSGSEWDCENNGCNPGDHMAHVMTPDWDSGYKGTGYIGWAPIPARAWLLAILRAVKAQEGNDGAT